MQQEPLLPSFWKSSKSLFTSDVKYCRRCGQGTTKNERDTCKVCGLSSWISRTDKDKLHPRWLVIGSVIPPPNSSRATLQRSAPRDPTIAKNIRSNYLFINFYPHLSWQLIEGEFKRVGVHPKNMFHFGWTSCRKFDRSLSRSTGCFPWHHQKSFSWATRTNWHAYRGGGVLR